MDRFQWVDLYSMNQGVMNPDVMGTPGTESNRLEDAWPPVHMWSISGVPMPCV